MARKPKAAEAAEAQTGDTQPIEGTEAAAGTGNAPQAGSPVPPADTPAPAPVLRVFGPAKGFRRAGRDFGAEPVDIPVDDLSEDELAAILAEPELHCGLIEPD